MILLIKDKEKKERKTKGFTSIELLAVIVILILSIIALMATPIVLNIINDARRLTNENGYWTNSSQSTMSEEAWYVSNDCTLFYSTF